MTAVLVTLVLDRYDGAQNPLVSGGGYFTPSQEFPDPADQMLIGQSPVPFSFRSGSLPSVKVIANDTAGPQGESLPGWTWNVTYSASTPGSPAAAAYYILSANGTTQYLSDLASTPAAQPGQMYLPLPAGTAVEGQVPEATGVGSASAWGWDGAGATVVVPKPAGATATDTPAITAAIASLASALSYGPATLLFQDGAYQVDSNSAVIRSVSNFAVRSSGRAVIEQAPNRAGLPNNVTGNVFVIADCADFTVEGITFDGMRDAVAPITPITAAVTSGGSSVTVAPGSGARYTAGQRLVILGGLGSGEQNQSEGFGVGYGTPLVVSSVTAGGGAGGGDLVAFTTTFANSYAHVSGTLIDDVTGGPYACSGAYLTSYQTGAGNSVAGRTLSGEDQQNGLHLINCTRFDVTGCTARNTWESPVKCGTGFASTSLTDGCSYGRITDNDLRHGYDQGVSLWLSNHVTVAANTMVATGWAGASCSLSDDCVIGPGNQIDGIIYGVPGDVSSGHGLAVEGGLRNLLTDNRVTSPNGVGAYLRLAPPVFAVSAVNSPTLQSFLEAGTAAGTSVHLSSSAELTAGGLYCILDADRTEAVTVQAVVDGTHVEFTAATQFSHASGCYVTTRVATDNTVADNTLVNCGANGVNPLAGARNKIKDNTITGWGSVTAGVPGITLLSTNSLLPASLGGDGSHVDGNTVTGGNGIPLAMESVAGVRATRNRLGSPVPGSGYQGLLVQSCTDFEVSGNWVSEVIGSQGIAVWAGSDRGIISGNKVRRCDYQGMLLQSCDSLEVTGNIAGGNGDGIYAEALTNSQVTGNICNGNGNHGIYLGDNSGAGSTGNTVTGNTARDDGSGVSVSTGNAQTQQNGITEAGSSDLNLFTGNELDSNAASQLTIVGAASCGWDNIISGAVVPGSAPGALPYSTAEPLASGESVFARLLVNSSVSLVSETLFLSYWTAATSGDATTVVTATANGGSGLTYAAVGVFSVAEDGDLTLLGSTGDLHSTLWASGYSAYTSSLSFTRVAGRRHALGVLAVGSGMPQISAATCFYTWDEAAPMIFGSVTGQTAMPSTVSSGSIAGYAGSGPNAVVAP